MIEYWNSSICHLIEREEREREKERGGQFCILPLKIKSSETAMNTVNHIHTFSRFLKSIWAQMNRRKTKQWKRKRKPTHKLAHNIAEWMKESRSWRRKWKKKNCAHSAHFYHSLSLFFSFENRNNKVLSCSVHTSKCQTMKTKSLPTTIFLYRARTLSLALSWEVLSFHIVCVCVCAHCAHCLPQAHETYYILKYSVRARRICWLYTNRVVHCCTYTQPGHKLYKHAQ